MSERLPFGYAQGRELVERQMVFDSESGMAKAIDIVLAYK